MSVTTPDVVRAAILADSRRGLSVRAIGVKHRVSKSTVSDIVRAAEADTRTADGPKAGIAARGAGQHGEAPAVARAREPRPPTVEAIGPELRRDLRRGVSGIARFIASAGERVSPDGQIIPQSEGDEGPDWQQVAHAARALDILLARVPDVMTFDETTNGKANTSEADAIAARVRATIARRHATVEPAELIAFDGGKSEVG